MEDIPVSVLCIRVVAIDLEQGSVWLSLEQQGQPLLPGHFRVEGLRGLLGSGGRAAIRLGSRYPVSELLALLRLGLAGSLRN